MPEEAAVQGADADPSPAGAEQIRTVAGARHPGGEDAASGCQAAGSPGEVLAEGLGPRAPGARAARQRSRARTRSYGERGRVRASRLDQMRIDWSGRRLCSARTSFTAATRDCSTWLCVEAARLAGASVKATSARITPTTTPISLEGSIGRRDVGSWKRGLGSSTAGNPTQFVKPLQVREFSGPSARSGSPRALPSPRAAAPCRTIRRARERQRRWRPPARASR